MDLRTNIEKKRAVKHQAIIDDYRAIAKGGNYAPTRIMGALADKYGMTTMGVRYVLVRNNINIKSQQQ